MNGIGYSRDIGRSSIIGNRAYVQFGDTFCKNHAGEFLGIVNHTCALIPRDGQPTDTQYQKFTSDGRVRQFIPLTDQEESCEDAGSPPGRTTLWSFGGIAEDQPGLGWTWFEKGRAVSSVQFVLFVAGVALS